MLVFLLLRLQETLTCSSVFIIEVEQIPAGNGSSYNKC